MRTLALGVAVALATLAAAGCGGAKHTASAPLPPKLPRALAQAWAQQADEIAAALAAGDGCTAETQAVALRTQVVQAANERQIAQRYIETLVATVNDLPGRIACTPAPADTKHKDNGKHKGKHGNGGD